MTSFQQLVQRILKFLLDISCSKARYFGHCCSFFRNGVAVSTASKSPTNFYEFKKIRWSASEVTTLWRYTNVFIIIIIFLAHQHKACRQLKIKQEMTAVGD